MKTTTIVFVTLVLTSARAWSQPPDSLWSERFGGASGEACYSVLQAADGGYILGGYTQSYGAGWNDFWLVKTDANGDSLWSRTFGGGDNNMCEAVIQTADGGLVLAGSKELWENGAYNHDFWLIRTNQNGDSVWSRTLGGLAEEWAYSLQATADGGYIMGGMTTIYGVPINWEFALTKATASGDSVWSRRYGGPNEERCYFALPTDDGGYLAVGSTQSFGLGQPLYTDGWIVKTDAEGDSVWSQAYGGDGMDEFIGAVQTSDGGYALAGTTNSFGAGTPGYLNFWLVRINAGGDTLWTRTFGGEVSDRCEGLLQLSDGGLVMVGSAYSYGSGDTDMWMVRTDGNGNLLWQRAFGGSNVDRGYAIAPTSDGGYILGGETSSFGFVDMWLVKTGPESGGGSETTLLNESFDGSFPPTGWQTQQLGPVSDNWQPLAGAFWAGCEETVHSGANAVFHNDDNGTAGADVHNLLISPEIQIPTNAAEVRLRFYQRNCYMTNFYVDSSHHWVLSSVNDGLWTLLIEPSERQDDWAEINIVIPGAAGQQFRIAFDYQGDYATEWYLDDVTITARLPQPSDPVGRWVPLSIKLLDPYPNPFNPVTQITYELPTAARMTLKVFDLLGREVAVLTDGFSEAGSHRIAFNGTHLASGIYFVRLDAGPISQTKKLMLLK